MNAVCAEKKKYGMAVYCYRQAVESLCVCISFVIFEDLVEARAGTHSQLSPFPRCSIQSV